MEEDWDALPSAPYFDLVDGWFLMEGGFIFGNTFEIIYRINLRLGILSYNALMCTEGPKALAPVIPYRIMR